MTHPATARYNAIDPKERGIIIVDACSLMALSGKTPNGGHFYDILPFLAKNGYEVMIPDMVAFEVEEVLADGTSLASYFKNGKRHDGEMRAFLEHVAKDHHPGLSIVPTEKPEHIREFLDGVIDITSHYGPSQRSRYLLMEHNDAYRSRRDWGDHSIRHILQQLPAHPPVHVLSEDHRFLNEIGTSMPDLNILSVSGLLLGMAESGLSKATPFLDGDADANQLLNQCRQGNIAKGQDGKIGAEPYDVSMRVLHTTPRMAHDCPMFMSLIHTARSLGLSAPDSDHSIIAGDKPMVVEEESAQISALRRKNIESRRNLKGGVDRGGGMLF